MNLGKFVPPVVSEAWNRVVGKSGLAAFAQSWLRGDDVDERPGNRLVAPYMQSPWVFAAINLVSGEFTGLPLKFYAGDQEYADAGLEAWWAMPALGNDRKPVARGDVDKILALHMQLHGEFFLLLDPTWATASLRRGGVSTSRFVIARPDRIRLIVQAGELQGYAYTDPAGRQQVYLPEEVIHKMEPNPYDDWRGLGRAQVARVAIEGVFLTGTYIRDLMRNNGDQGFIVIGKNGVASEEQKAAIVADLQAKRRALRQGLAKDLFLTGDITVDRPEEQAAGADLANTKTLSQQEIFIAFCVPPSMSTVKQSYSIGKDSDRYQLVTGTSQPLSRQICGAYSELASRQTGKAIVARHNWDEHPVMQEVRNSRLEAGQKLWASGMSWKDVNDYLGLGMKPFKGWEIPYLPFAVVPLDSSQEAEPTKDQTLAEDNGAAEDEGVKSLRLLLAVRARVRNASESPGPACACGCAPLDGLLEQIDKERDSKEVALWREHMKSRREQAKGFESRFRSSLFKARAETLRNIESAAKLIAARTSLPIEQRATAAMIEIPITSNAADVLRKLEAMPSAMAANVAKAMDLQNQLTIGHSQATYLTGPRPKKLGVVSNRLRSSLNAPPAVVTGLTIESKIGTNVKYAGAHEAGVDKVVQVKAYTRRNYDHGKLGVGSATTLLFDMKTGQIKRGRTIKRAAKTEVQVKAFKRHMKMPRRAFLEPAILDRKQDYGNAISAALLASWQGGAS